MAKRIWLWALPLVGFGVAVGTALLSGPSWAMLSARSTALQSGSETVG